MRLHADNDTVRAVEGEPVESAADITVSDPVPSAPTAAPTPTPQVSGRDAGRRMGGRGSPNPGGKA